MYGLLNEVQDNGADDRDHNGHDASDNKDPHIVPPWSKAG